MNSSASPMPPVDPALKVLLAKSEPRDKPETLVAHTWEVLSRLADQKRLRPHLAQDVSQPRLWHWLYWGTFLHDFGKAASGFQDLLRGKAKKWGFRHEVLSLAFVDWLFPHGHADRPYVIAVIACHHRDAAVIAQKYAQNRGNPDEDSATKLIAQVGEATLKLLYQWLIDDSWRWAEALGFAADIERLEIISFEGALERFQPRAIHRAVWELTRYTDTLTDHTLSLVGALLRGMILMSDHAGSAHSAPFRSAPLERSAVLDTLRGEPFPHQHLADNAPVGSALLISPTSSGKTEAALLWLARQQLHDGLPAPRIFYLLPYQASINAAHTRLQRIFRRENEVGLQHSRMMQVLYSQALADQQDNENAIAYARGQAELTRLLLYPVTVMTPYQLLKVPYQLKGFEALLTHFYGGHFILDEIHVYNAKRLALFIAVIEFLERLCGARFFIMTATLPPPVRAVLDDALPNLHLIMADNATFQQFQRHRAHVLDGDLLASQNLERIVEDAADKSILICCNTVRRAFEVYTHMQAALNAHYPDNDFDVILLHSRFNSRDRNAKEARILERTGVGSSTRKRTIVVATQVVEVSLNLDLDVLYSEAAPLEALLQRFGRVNRARPAGSPLADVYVVREQPEAVKWVYSLDLVAAALDCLEASNNQAIDESQIAVWLAQIYQGDALAEWQTVYAESYNAFQAQAMSQLKPFNNSGLDDLFFQMFDGLDVLPVAHLSTYEALFREGKYLEAAGYFISVAWRDYKRLERMGKAWHDRPSERSTRDLYIVEVPYSSETGLDIYSVYQVDKPASMFDDFDVPDEAD